MLAARPVTKQRLPLRLATIIAAFAAAMPARAADPEIWGTLGADGQISEKIGWDAEIIARFGDDQGGLYEIEAGAYLEYQLADPVTVSGGYAYVPNYEDGDLTSREHRLRQQVAVTVGEIAGGEVEVRGRLEQRFRDDGDETGWRLRARIAWDRPLGGEDAPTLKLWHESSWGLNDTDWGQFTGYNRSRSFAGVEFDLNDLLSLETGYIHQLSLSESGPDETAHVLSLSLAAGF